MPSIPPHPEPNARRAWLLGFATLAVGLNLRPLFGSLSVVLPEVMRDTGLSASGASVLTTLPLLCLGVFAWPAPRLARWMGARRALLAALLLVCAGVALRAVGALPALFLATAMAGAGIAIANVLLPALIKRDFGGRVGLMMGLYTLSVCAGASGSAALTVPIEHLLGGAWPKALGAWAIPAAAAVLLWMPFGLRDRGPSGAAGSAGPGLGRSALAWQVTAFMGLQSSLGYVTMGWLAPMLRERGLDSVTAGLLVALSISVQLASCLVTPAVASRCRDQRALAVLVAAGTLAALLSLLLGPLGAVWWWAVLLGICQGGSFSLALTFFVLRAPDAAATARLSAMAQGWGYLIASAGLLGAGLIRGWTGGFEGSAWLMAAIAAGMAWSGWGAGRARQVGAAV